MKYPTINEILSDINDRIRHETSEFIRSNDLKKLLEIEFENRFNSVTFEHETTRKKAQDEIKLAIAICNFYPYNSDMNTPIDLDEYPELSRDESYHIRTEVKSIIENKK